MVAINETERLIFRELAHSDIGNLQQIFSDPVTMQFYASTKSNSETLDWIDWNIRSYRDNGFGLWALIDKMNCEFVGQCGIILQHNVDGVDEWEIGYLLVRKYWGRGLAIEAATACRDYAFTRLKCQRIISLIDPENKPSIKVAERNGMIFEKDIERWNKTISVYSQASNCYNKALQRTSR